MKFAYWVILALVVFNFMVVMTNNIGVFPSAGYSSQGMSNITAEYTNFSDENLLEKGMGLGQIGGVRLESIIVGAVALIGAVGLAYLCRSPVPLGIGCFVALFSGIMVQTYGVLQQFPIDGYLLAAGTAGLGIMVVISAIEMMTGGHTT